MDAPTAPPALPPPTTAVTAKAPTPSPIVATRSPDVVVAWPRCAQFAGVFLLGALTALLGVHALTYLRIGTEPSAIDVAQAVTYRVDLNEARPAELLQLPGIGPNLADRIDEYRRTQGGFRSVEDLLKVQGIGPTTLERLRPFVMVKKSADQPNTAKAGKEPKNSTDKIASLTEPIDVNKATLTELQKLPGIGPKKAQGIIDEREKRPFASVSELRRVSGIGPKTFEKIEPYVTVGANEK